jgi:hypothetical protein
VSLLLPGKLPLKLCTLRLFLEGSDIFSTTILSIDFLWVIGVLRFSRVIYEEHGE